MSQKGLLLQPLKICRWHCLDFQAFADILRGCTASGKVPSTDRDCSCKYPCKPWTSFGKNFHLCSAWFQSPAILPKVKHLNSNSFLVSLLANSSHKPTKVRVQQVKSLILVLSVHLPFHPRSINSPFLHKSFNLFRHSRYWSLLNRWCFYMIVIYVEINTSRSIYCYIFAKQ